MNVNGNMGVTPNRQQSFGMAFKADTACRKAISQTAARHIDSLPLDDELTKGIDFLKELGNKLKLSKNHKEVDTIATKQGDNLVLELSGPQTDTFGKREYAKEQGKEFLEDLGKYLDEEAIRNTATVKAAKDAETARINDILGDVMS